MPVKWRVRRGPAARFAAGSPEFASPGVGANGSQRHAAATRAVRQQVDQVLIFHAYGRALVIIEQGFFKMSFLATAKRRHHGRRLFIRRILHVAAVIGDRRRPFLVLDVTRSQSVNKRHRPVASA